MRTHHLSSLGFRSLTLSLPDREMDILFENHVSARHFAKADVSTFKQHAIVSNDKDAAQIEHIA